MKYPSVTKILDATMPAEKRAGLEAWKKRVGEVEANRIRDEAFARGRKIDADVDEWRVRGACDDPRIAQHLTGYAFVHHEYDVRSEAHQYQGRLDAVLSINGRNILVDFKGANRPKPRKYMEDYELQIGAYYGACLEMGVAIDCGCVCVFVDGEERPTLHWIDEMTLGHRLREFLLRVEQYKSITL
jgi:hypothetical protein